VAVLPVDPANGVRDVHLPESPCGEYWLRVSFPQNTFCEGSDANGFIRLELKDGDNFYDCR
jgi:hypothetical protein